jgi:hypothetical protein
MRIRAHKQFYNVPRTTAAHSPPLSLCRPNVVIDQALYPLPVLRRHMTVVVTQYSTTSLQAAAFGVPTFFLNEAKSRQTYPALYASGQAFAVDVQDLNTEIARLPTPRRRQSL